MLTVETGRNKRRSLVKQKKVCRTRWKVVRAKYSWKGIFTQGRSKMPR